MRNMRRHSYTEPILMPDLPRMRESKSPIADLLQSTDYSIILVVGRPDNKFCFLEYE